MRVAVPFLASNTPTNKAQPRVPLRFGIQLDSAGGLQRLDTFETQQASALDICHFVGIEGGLHKLPGIATGIRQTVEQAQAGNRDYIVLQGGDVFLNKDLASIKRGIAALNHMNLHGQVWGNHDFDLGIDGLVIAASRSNFPILVHNIKLEGDHHPLRQHIVHQRAAVLTGQASGQPYGLIGLTMPEIHKEVTGGTDLQGVEGMTFDETVRQTQKLIEDLRGHGVQRVLILSHMGSTLDNDLQEALHRRKINNVVIINTKLADEPLQHGHDKSLLAAPAPSADGSLSVLSVPYNGDGSFQLSYADMPTDRLAADETVLQIVTPEASPAVVQFQFYREHESGDPAQAVATDKYQPEMSLRGNDGLAQWVSKQLQDQTGTDIAFCKSALIRSNIDTGTPVTEEQLKNGIFKSNQLLAVRHVKGSHIRQALEESAQTLMEEPVNKSRRGILHSAQLKYTLNLDPDHHEARVSELQIKKGVEWVALEDNKEYSVAGDSFLFRNEQYFSALHLDALGIDAGQDMDESDETVGHVLCEKVKSESGATPPLIPLRPESLITFNRPT